MTCIHPPLDPARAVHIRAMLAYIEARLDRTRDALPFRAAERLASELAAAQVADIVTRMERGAEVTRIAMYSVTARTTGTVQAAFREWQRLATDRLTQGVAA